MITQILNDITVKILMVTTAVSTLPVGAHLTPSLIEESAKIVIEQTVEYPEPLPISLERGYTMKVPITAYSSTPDQTDDSPFITANQSIVRDGIVAANFLKFGTRIKIPSLYGEKEFVVADRMNKRYTYRIDIWMPKREQAQNFGIKYAYIEILEPAESLVLR